MSDNVVKLFPAREPDEVLEQAVGVYDQVLVIGYDKEGELDVRGSLNFPMKDVFFAIEVFKFMVLNGEFGHRLTKADLE